MKKLLSVLLVFVSSLTMAQQVSFDNIPQGRGGGYTSYLASDGAVYKIGDKIKIGIPSSNKTFAYIQEGNMVMGIANANVNISGESSEIKKISIQGNKRSGYYVYLTTKSYTGLNNYYIKFENALSSGEIIGTGYSSDDALSELKKAKDKLDLGLIEQTEYDNIKKELSKFIK